MKVRDILRRLADDGWVLVATKGSHRQFKHPVKPGRVTVAGKPSDDIAPGTWTVFGNKPLGRRSDFMRYAIVIEATATGYSAYAPDLPGCIATGSTVSETENALREAIAFHLDGLREDGLAIPQPVSRVDYVDIVAA